MAQLRVHPDRLEVHLTVAEKSLAVRWRDVVIPRSAIRSVTITEDAWVWLRGIRAPGTEIPLLLAIGTWKFHGGKDFVLIKGKSRSAVVLDLFPATDAGMGARAGASTDPDAGTLSGLGRKRGGGKRGAEISGIDNFSRVILTTPHAPALVAALERDGGDEVFAQVEDEHESAPERHPTPSRPIPVGLPG